MGLLIFPVFLLNFALYIFEATLVDVFKYRIILPIKLDFLKKMIMWMLSSFSFFFSVKFISDDSVF